ncbi:hypothetical protein [Candidatus Protochlamydia sp. W-9]|uniref:hypothetical protein n=1 Tax=Candidatus Protochlamydia sp. W-9 TaxID=1785087 RepID=UPI00096A520F|nr:hypothetical protein [Candidatus Protochlamydia sp. W-9]
MKSSIEKRLKKLEITLRVDKPKSAVVICDVAMLHFHDFSFIEAGSLILLPAKDNDESIPKGSYVGSIFLDQLGVQFKPLVDFC